jgi:murein DD-endopeptidase MepM/ murein hydrolase activator NlpD
LNIVTRKFFSRLAFLAFLAFLFLYGNRLGYYLFPVKSGSRVIIKTGEILKGGSLYSSLTPDFSVKETLLLTRSLAELYDPSDVKPADKYKVYHSTSGKILKFIYMPSPLVNYVADRSSTGYIVSRLVPEIEKKEVAVKGEISTSLYGAMETANVDSTTIMNFADMFQWQVDFLTDVRPQDRFLLIYEQLYVEGKAVERGNIIAAAYRGKVGNYTAIRYKNSYYSPDGSSLKKQFLKAPLRYRRISSHFSYRRRHPILKYVRPHLGIDYAAPYGTPISSIGSGKVIYAGWKGGYGKTVVVRHNSIYTTQYGHLSKYARNIRKGVYVKQGQDIGYVGSSGVSTGPHLDFRINKYGKPVNFLKLKLPPAKSVNKEELKEFKEAVDKASIYLKYMISDFFKGAPVLIEEYISRISTDAVHTEKIQK